MDTNMRTCNETQSADEKWVDEELIPFLNVAYGPHPPGYWTKVVGQITLQLPIHVRIRAPTSRIFPPMLTLLLPGSPRRLSLDHRALPPAFGQPENSDARRAQGLWPFS
jgi:hypothetical protein